MPFIQRFGPNNAPTMLMDTWNHEYLTMMIPVMPWNNTESMYKIRFLKGLGLDHALCGSVILDKQYVNCNGSVIKH
jgi:hypothetical protein